MRYRKRLITLVLIGYLIGIKGGQVAIWKLDDPQPLRVFPWSAAMLPSQIRSALEKGIRVEADSDIGRLLDEMIA